MPVADEVNRLQNGSDAECKLFQEIAEQGHYAGRERPSSTRQGIYAAAPDGRFLASINSRSARRVARMLRSALDKWHELEPTTKAIEEPTAKRVEDRLPKDAFILRVTSRDLPRSVREDWRAYAWNHDFAWFSGAEARSMAPEKASVGQRYAIPRKLCERISRFHLIDNVRGQTTGYAEKDVEASQLDAIVVAIQGRQVAMRIEGRSRTEQSGEWRVAGFREGKSQQKRGIAADLLGFATYDLDREAFIAFEMVAIGSRWGATRYNARRDDLDAAPIGFRFELYRGTDRVAPACYWSYDW